MWNGISKVTVQRYSIATLLHVIASYMHMKRDFYQDVYTILNKNIIERVLVYVSK